MDARMVDLEDKTKLRSPHSMIFCCHKSHRYNNVIVQTSPASSSTSPAAIGFVRCQRGHYHQLVSSCHRFLNCLMYYQGMHAREFYLYMDRGSEPKFRKYKKSSIPQSSIEEISISDATLISSLSTRSIRHRYGSDLAPWRGDARASQEKVTLERASPIYIASNLI